MPLRTRATSPDAARSPRSGGMSSRAATPAPVKAADAEVAAVQAHAAARPRPQSPCGRPTPQGFRAASPTGQFPPACVIAAAPLRPTAASTDDDETDVEFRRARDALLLRARAQLAVDAKLRGRSAGAASACGVDAAALPCDAAEALSEWSTDDGGVTWRAAAPPPRSRAAAASARRALATTPMPLPPRASQPAAAVATRAELARLALLPLCVYLALVGVWHHVQLLWPAAAARMLQA